MDGFFSEYFGFYLSVSFHQCSKLIHSFIHSHQCHIISVIDCFVKYDICLRIHTVRLMLNHSGIFCHRLLSVAMNHFAFG
jgi:hypothetical protein